MARKVKCWYTKEYGTNETFFKAEDGHYYKDEETYNAYLIEKNKPKVKKVICSYTKEPGTSDTFYLAEDGNWYKDEKTYQFKLKNGQLYKQITDKISEFFGYFEGQKFPTNVMKKLKELDEYGRDVILDTINQCEPNIIYALNTKEFNSDYHKGAYIMAIIQNHINDVYNQKIRDAKQKAISNKYVKAFEEVTISAADNKQTTKDITRFLEDDLWN